MTAASMRPQRRVLLLSPFFFPEPISTGKYNTTLASAIAEDKAHSVTVVCSHPLYPAWVPERTHQEITGVTTLRGGAWLRYPRSTLLRRGLLEMWFAFHAAFSLICIRLAGRSPDLVICVFPPSLFAIALRWLLPKGTKVFGIVHDLQGVLASKQTEAAKGRGIVQRVICSIERASLRSCDELVFLSEGMRNWCKSMYGLIHTPSSVFFPFASPLPRPSETQIAAIRKLLVPGVRHMVYSGALGEKQAPEKLARMLLDLCKRYPGWRAHIFSSGPVFAKLRDMPEFSNISFHDLVPESLLPALLVCSDLQVVPQESGTSIGAFPSKLPNIIQFSTPLMCIADSGSEVAQLAESYAFGTVAYDWSSKSYSAAFELITALDFSGTESDAEFAHRFSVSALVEYLLRE